MHGTYKDGFLYLTINTHKLKLNNDQVLNLAHILRHAIDAAAAQTPPATNTTTNLYNCPHCGFGIGGLNANGDIQIEMLCPNCQTDLMDDMVKITGQPFKNGVI